MIKTYTYKIKTDDSFIEKFNQWLGTLFMEDLNVKGMSQSKLAKYILDCGWTSFKDLLSYKSKVVLVNAKYTSQICSSCGHIDKRNRVSQSKFVCVKCGAVFNADQNASINIKSKGIALMCERKAVAYA